MKTMTPKQFVSLYEKYGSVKAVSRKTGTRWGTTHAAYKTAVAEGLMEPLPLGRKNRDHMVALAKGKVKAVPEVIIEGMVKAPAAGSHPLNYDKRGIARILLTSAQNNTALHDKFWDNLLVFKDHIKADLLISQFAYIKSGFGALGDKESWLRGEKYKMVRDFWFDPRIVKYASNEKVQIAPGLVWCGDENISPSDSNPLSGLQVITGRASAIVPHTKIAMESVASAKSEPTKFLYTTGAVTLKNYIARKAGKKADFHHCFGALLVEVDRAGNWWCRQINADSKGTFYDRDPGGDKMLRVQDGKVTTGHRAAGITWGDTHADQIDPVVKEVQHGPGGVVDVLQPQDQFFHDVLDFFRRNHHEIKDSFSMLERHATRKEDVREECVVTGDFLEYAKRKFCNNVVVDSNHDRALGRWLNEQDGRRDPVNFLFWSEMNAQVANTIHKTGNRGGIFKQALEKVCGAAKLKGVRFLQEDESYIICHEHGGGIECGMHGDRGPNGSRGSLYSFARVGRKANVGHSHVAGIKDGICQAGCSCILYPDYVHGPSAWSHSFIVTAPNGKRQIYTVWAGRAWA